MTEIEEPEDRRPSAIVVVLWAIPLMVALLPVACLLGVWEVVSGRNVKTQ